MVEYRSKSVVGLRSRFGADFEEVDDGLFAVVFFEGGVVGRQAFGAGGGRNLEEEFVFGGGGEFEGSGLAGGTCRGGDWEGDCFGCWRRGLLRPSPFIINY